MNPVSLSGECLRGHCHCGVCISGPEVGTACNSPCGIPHHLVHPRGFLEWMINNVPGLAQYIRAGHPEMAEKIVEHFRRTIAQSHNPRNEALRYAVGVRDAIGGVDEFELMGSRGGAPAPPSAPPSSPPSALPPTTSQEIYLLKKKAANLLIEMTAAQKALSSVYAKVGPIHVKYMQAKNAGITKSMSFYKKKIKAIMPQLQKAQDHVNEVGNEYGKAVIQLQTKYNITFSG